MGDLWGKQDRLPGPYRLLWHLVDTAAAAYVLWEVHLPAGVRAWLAEQLGMDEERARRFVAFLAGLHDVGKACPCFQEQQPKRGAQDWIHHAMVSYLALPDLLRDPDREYEIFLLSSPYRIGELLGGHHGGFPPPDHLTVRKPAKLKATKLGGVTWQDRRRELVEELWTLLGRPEIPVEIHAPVAGVLAGMVILADWIASDTEWIKASQWTAPTDPADRWGHTATALWTRVPGLGLSVPELRDTMSTRLLIGHEPNPLQESIEREFRPAGPGLLVITASTGYGKTEAAFLAVHRFGQVTGRPGMVVCLPTQATTNAMWRRGTKFAEKATGSDRPVTLAHAMRAYYEPYRDYCADDVVLEWLNGRRRPLLAGMSVVTLDQVLIAALATQYNMLRLWGLLGKTLVVDEVHAADPYLQALLARLLSWCGYLRIPVVLLSATLPGHITRQLTKAYLIGVDPNRNPDVEVPAYPGWLFTSAEGEIARPSAGAVAGMREHGRRKARIEHVRYTSGDRIKTIIGYLTRAARQGGCVAVVCSTVASAQWTYRCVRAKLPKEVPVWLLHSRFPYQQYCQIEDEVTTRFGKNSDARRPRPRTGVVVSTSIIEQDVDFDLMISDLVPVALLIQRLGRAWRHQRGHRPDWIPMATLVVLDPLVEPLPREWTDIYSAYELLATREVLAGHGPDLIVPDQVDDVVQHVHDLALPQIKEANESTYADRQETTALHKALAGYVTIPAPHMLGNLCDLTNPDIEDTDVTTRLGVDNARLIPQYTSEDGRWWLDPKHKRPFPAGNPRQHVAAMIDASVTCPAAWVRGWANPLAEKWKRTPLAGAILFPAPEHEGLRLDGELGLVKGTLRDDL